MLSESILTIYFSVKCVLKMILIRVQINVLRNIEMFANIIERYRHAKAAFGARRQEDLNEMLNAGVYYPNLALASVLRATWEATGAFIFNRPSRLVSRGVTPLAPGALARFKLA